MRSYGKKRWFIADGFLPVSIDTEPYQSHEAICVLNTGDTDSKIDCNIYFTDQEPLTGTFICPARRSVHMRMNDLVLENGENIPVGKPYSASFFSSEPVVLQFTRVDTAQKDLALMSGIAYSE